MNIQNQAQFKSGWPRLSIGEAKRNLDLVFRANYLKNKTRYNFFNILDLKQVLHQSNNKDFRFVGFKTFTGITVNFAAILSHIYCIYCPDKKFGFK